MKLVFDCEDHARLFEETTDISVPSQLSVNLCSEQSCLKFLTSLRCRLYDQRGKVLGGVIRNSKHLKLIKVESYDDAVCDLLEQVVNPSKCSLQIGFNYPHFGGRGCTLTSVGTVKLASLLPRFNNIISLCLNLSDCCASAVDTLVPSITHKTLRSLVLRGISLTPAAAAALGRSLPEMSSLLTLELTGADGSIVQAEEMEALFGGFNKTLPLEHLTFSGFSVSSCLAPLTKSFRYFPKLRRLDLHNLNLDERNLCGLLESFRIIPNLAALFLSRNPLGHAVNIYRAIRHQHSKLEFLVIDQTGSKEDLNYVRETIKQAKPHVQLEHNRGGLDIRDVVVDPHVSQHLRPHQRDGVMFLYECVMGLRNFNGNGAILADDMGLGKTLQCISLIWTLHKQGMYGGNHSVKRTLIITPGSLVKNWSSEFRKWLGNERLKVYTVNSDKRVKEFMNSPLYPVMIISYEMFLRSVEEMISGTQDKETDSSYRNSSAGRPLNDLKEFHSLVDVCNPGILGTQSCFRRLYEEPIVHGQQPDATSEEKLLGQTRAAELNRLTSMFFLRRTAEVNSRYLPPQVESVVFCRPSLLQLSVYRHLLTSRVVRSCLTSYSSGGSRHLVCIGALKKLCNDPSLIYSQCQQANEMADSLDIDQEASVYEGLDRSFPESYKPDRFTTDHSGKLQVLSHILAQIHRIGERTLDLLQKLCENRSYDFLRLDGKTPTSKRQSLVDRFNDKHCKIFVFLLSSKAGGVGLNLIGASRLVLFDIDWNPANDIQSMARVWRDGQKNTVHIYRLLTTGTIEEKIYQRQTAKQGLSGTVADAKESVKIEFSRDELKDLFTLHENTLCLTHDLLQCTCLVAEVESDDECQSEPGANQQSVTRPCQLGSCDNNSNQKKSLDSRANGLAALSMSERSWVRL
ncbi:DNA repair and recombination protein rad54b [Desmophyllum pertusum]|uniref:DNA repair and recombination protein rad54b n=1 Tax=Desmophyllum pertusum TaxID=174260 RepID=A0A9W9Z2P7_9CNID|nr:DNA repair and recombination protein rad54b [Desmophyllum pertusum]